MEFTLREIAKLVGGEVVGDPDTVITGISGIQEAQAGDITFLANPKYQPLLKTTKASAVITSRDVAESVKPLVRADNPSRAFSKLVEMATSSQVGRPQGIHDTAVIHATACVGKNVAIGPCTIIEENAVIGDNTVIYGGCYIGSQVQVGCNCLVYPHVTLRERVTIGNRVILHSGVVVGSDGFGFILVEDMPEKIPQLGTVVIEDDVEVGANVTIDRARFDKTLIGKGTKIDNLVQIGHNVMTGPNCIIIAQTGISGSTHLGKGVILAGQTGIAGHITIGDGAVVAAQAGVSKSIPAGEKVWGTPAKPHMTEKRINASLQKLPELNKKVKELEQTIENLKKRLGDDG